MADSYTPNLNLRKPEVGAADSTWGGVAGLNGDLDLLDAVFLATGLGTSVGLYVGAGKTLNVEGSMQLADSTDTTKRAVLLSSLISTATTRSYSFPDQSGTLATVDMIAPVGTIFSGYFGAIPPAGYVFADGRTIGSLISGATNRANADTERLFLHLWAFGFAVVGGRGASAAADWAADRQLSLPNHSGRVMAGRDNLSGTAAGILSGYTAPGTVGGVQSISVGVTGVSGTESGSVGVPSTGGATVVALQNHTHTAGGYNVTTGIVQPSIAVDVIIAL